jgi:glycosyltransferase involved in cell wall biosynthesis
MSKIALLTHDNGKGGAAIAVSRLAKGLIVTSQESKEFNFTLLAAVVNEKDFSVSKRQIGGATNYVNSIARNFLNKAIAKMWSYVHRTSRSPRLFFMQGYRDVRMELQEFDVINMFWMQMLADLSKLEKIRKPKVITLHDMWFLTGGCSYSFGCEKFRFGCNDCDYMWAPLASDASKQYSAKDKILSNDTTQVVVTSKWMRDVAVARGIDDSKISIIKNYIPDNYHFFNDKAMARELLGIHVDLKHKQILYFVGEIGDPRKGFDLFCNAITLLPFYLRKEILVMHLGPVDISQDMLLKDAAIDIIHLGSFVDDVPQIIAYNAADYLICPSRYDNTPNVIAEAHMCGLPVIAASTTGTAEMVSAEDNGILANVADAEEFACTLENALINAGSFEKLSICENAKLTYGSNATCHNYLNLYRSMM